MKMTILATTAVVVAFAMANAASASAAALYVDDSGVDTGFCTAPSSPCDTIGYAITQAGATDVIHLGGGTYSEAVTLTNAVSLIEDSTFSAAASGPAVLDNPNMSAAITLQGTGTVDGLTIRSVHNPVRVEQSGTLSNNRFEFPNAPAGFHLGAVAVSAFIPVSPTITGNTFVDPNPADSQSALVVNTSSGGSPVISDNSFSGFNTAIQAFGGTPITPTISGNTITGTHGSGSGILIGNTTIATVSRNNIHSPGAGSPTGILVAQNNPAQDAGATLSRNRVIGHNRGVDISGNTASVTLSSDLIAKSVTTGLRIQDGSTPGIGASATNVTVVDTVSGPDVVVDDVPLSLDSSIVGAGSPFQGVSGLGIAICTITYSRGTGTDAGPGTGCATGFDTAADPMFANPAANDYHLSAGSPMIDAGNTAPAPGVLDIDGDPRALAVAAQCTTPPAGLRDIGADEFVTTCPPPPTPPTANTPTTKKCKKGQKLKKGKCVKKKRKKK